KYGDTFIVLDSHGDIGASAGGSDGLFHADTRFLSQLAFRLNGTEPLLLGSNVRDDNALLAIDLTNPDIYAGDELKLPKDTVHIVRTVFVWRNTAYQRLAIRNYGDHPIELDITFTFDSDFADLFEVRGLRRPRRGMIGRSVIHHDRATLSYQGLDGKLRRTLLAFDPAPTILDPKQVSYRFSLRPGHMKPIFLASSCDREAETSPRPFARVLPAATRQ